MHKIQFEKSDIFNDKIIPETVHWEANLIRENYANFFSILEIAVMPLHEIYSLKSSDAYA